eukprot:20117-Heterococcus_DN1.PRE.1
MLQLWHLWIISIVLVIVVADVGVGYARPKHICEKADSSAAVVALAETTSKLQATEDGLATSLTTSLCSTIYVPHAAVCLKRRVERPLVASKQWTNYFTVKYFDMYMNSTFDTRALLPTCIPSSLQTVPLTTDWCGPPPQDGSIVYLPELEEVARLDLKRQPEVLAETLLALLPAHALNALVALLLKRLGKVGYACLHLCNQVRSTARVLMTWRCSFHQDLNSSAPPGQYTVEQIAAKVGASIAAGHALQNMNKLYITGAYNANETAHLQTTFGKHFKEVYTKDTLLHGNAKDFLGKLDGMQAAIIDLEVCKQATIFIGNNHYKLSLHCAFSELLYWQRVYDAAFKSYGLYGDHKKRNLQVNSMAVDEPLITSMKEFCPEKVATDERLHQFEEATASQPVQMQHVAPR